ncbi:MAG: YdeI/OmpD-associated family protein [Chitinophagales bacterium]
MKVTYYKTSAEFRKWLVANHDLAIEHQVGFFKKHSGKKGISYSEAVDQALCFGWIDGITRRIDENRYTIRFTPRKPRSNWSNVNINKVRVLIASGLMMTPGLRALEARDEKKTGIYAFEQGHIQLDAKSEKKFRSNKKAWKFFQSQTPSYRKTCTWWIMTAKKEETCTSKAQYINY